MAGTPGAAMRSTTRFNRGDPHLLFTLRAAKFRVPFNESSVKFGSFRCRVLADSARGL